MANNIYKKVYEEIIEVTQQLLQQNITETEALGKILYITDNKELMKLIKEEN